jgi:hypothetical protein
MVCRQLLYDSEDCGLGQGFGTALSQGLKPRISGRRGCPG